MNEFDAVAQRMMLRSKAERAETKLQEVEEVTTEIAAVTHDAIESEAEEERQEIGFNARLLVQATLPHRKPDPAVTVFERSNGYITMRIMAPPVYGLPFGTYPRLLLAWLTTEAVRIKSPELELGSSLAAFMAKLDLGKSGGTQGVYPRMRQHMIRLFSSVVSATVKRNGELHDIGFRPVERFSLFWDSKRPDQGTLWQSSISLNQRFFEEITRSPVPVDMAALRELAKGRSPMAIDLYQWLTYRMSYLRKPTPIPWARLQLQFGCDYGRTRAFKAAFLRQLKRVIEVYPQARVEVERDYLRLLPSSTHIPMRLVKGQR